MDRKRIGKTFFIPASGRRSYNSQLGSVSSYGMYWSTAPCYATFGYRLAFTSSYVYPQDDNFNRTFGFSVRPVQK